MSSSPLASVLFVCVHNAGRSQMAAGFLDHLAGDRIEVRESRRAREPFKLAKETLRSHQAPEWLSLDAAKLAGTVADLPRRDQMPLDLNEQLVVEYYSR